MNHDEKLAPTNISEILEKMNDNLRSFAIRETEWIIQKNSYESKIAELEGEISAHEQINIDLMKRIKMLEYALIQERNRNSNENNNYKEDKANNNINKDLNPTDIYNLLEKKELMSDEELNSIKEKASRPSLLAMLNEIGINENFANELFTDLELNKAELERLIKKDIEERTMLVNDKLNLHINENSNNKKETNRQDNQANNNIKQQNETPKSKPGQLILNQNNYTELKSHFDVVRKLSYMPKQNYLVSIAEDCLINVWQTNKLTFNNTVSDLEPLYSFRGHTGPLFSLETHDDLIYSAGNEGIIKIWKLPKYSEVSPFSDSEVLFNCNIAFFQKTSEIIWDMKHHPTKNVLVALASDGMAYFWKTVSGDEYLQALTENKLDKLFLTQVPVCNYNSNLSDVSPTSGIFLESDNNIFVSGLTDGNISFIDVTKASIINTTKNTKHLINNSNITENSSGKKLDPDLLSTKLDINSKYNVNNSINNMNFSYNDNNLNNSPGVNQVNSLVSSFSNNIIYAGFENGDLKYFDYRTENCYTPVNAHEDAITSLSLMDDLYLFSTSHDTRVRMWDIRDMSHPVQEALGSQKKWDEAIWDSKLIPNIMGLATAGADSIIRVFKI